MALPNKSGPVSELDMVDDKKPIINPKTDIITAVTLMGLCVYLFFHALLLPRPDNTWRRAPGGMLLVLAVTLFFMALSLLISALKLYKINKTKDKNNTIEKQKKVKNTILTPFNIRQIIAIAITFFYGFIFLERMYFEFSSILYLFAIIKIFWKEGTLLKILLISILTPIVFSIIFTVLFNQGLPGGSLLSDLIFLLSKRGA